MCIRVTKIIFALKIGGFSVTTSYLLGIHPMKTYKNTQKIYNLILLKTVNAYLFVNVYIKIN